MPDFIFRLPLDFQLTDAQRIALDYDDSIVICGGPGSGKTVVTIYRFLVPIRNKKDVLLFTYNRTLLASIKGLLKAKSEELFGDLNEAAINGVIQNKVNSFYKWYGWPKFEITDSEDIISDAFNQKIRSRNGKKYAEIFFDEGQDLTPSVFINAFLLAEKISCGADNAQNLQGNFPPDQAVETILDNLNNQQYTDLQPLEANFRNTKEIFEFARSFVPDNEAVQRIDTSELALGEKPEVLAGLDTVAQLNSIKEIIEGNLTSNIGILVNYSNQVIDIKNYLERQGYSCKRGADPNLSFSYYYNGMPQFDEAVMFEKMKTPFIVTYDSCKGLEFDIVIMPFFNDCQNALTKPRPIKIKNEEGRYINAINTDGKLIYERNADGSTKMWATINHYYVGATRARTLLYVMCATIPETLKLPMASISIENDLDINDNLPF